jgi:hypothetical protein
VSAYIVLSEPGERKFTAIDEYLLAGDR